MGTGFELCPGELSQAKEAAVDPEPVAPLDVEVLLAVGVPGLPGLGSRKVAALGVGDLVECLCILLWISFHLQKPYILTP